MAREEFDNKQKNVNIFLPISYPLIFLEIRNWNLLFTALRLGPHRLSVRTQASQAWKRGSIPREVTTIGTSKRLDGFSHWFSLPPTQENQCGLGVPRASRAWRVRFKNSKAENFWREDFFKDRSPILNVRLPSPPVRTHQSSPF